ncbi:glycosyltransferase family 2 protein [Candidatus Bathyarchaeota archaeon]|nr:glycosyltransferase family 2 protein [Candidatus Bathyarchaeota archaeon]
MKVSILIPTKNEPYVNHLVKEIHKSLKINHEIIVIDKSDKLPKIKNALVVRQKSNGLGQAILEGLQHATGDVIVTMDGDGSHSPKDIPKLITALKQADIAIGSRFVEGGKTLDKTHRKFISFLFRKFTSFILGLDIKDNMSGFAAIKREVYDRIKLNPLVIRLIWKFFIKQKINSRQ